MSHVTNKASRRKKLATALGVEAVEILFVRKSARPLGNIFLINLNNRYEKVAMGVDPAFGLV